MTNANITAKIHELAEYEQMQRELNEVIDSIKDELKAILVELDTEELTITSDNEVNIIRYTTVLSQRFDTTKFKKALPEIYTAYLKQVSSKRFTIS